MLFCCFVILLAAFSTNSLPDLTDWTKKISIDKMLFCLLLFCRLPILTTKPLNHKTTKPQTYIDVCLNVQIYEKKQNLLESLCIPSGFCFMWFMSETDGQCKNCRP